MAGWFDSLFLLALFAASQPAYAFSPILQAVAPPPPPRPTTSHDHAFAFGTTALWSTVAPVESSAAALSSKIPSSLAAALKKPSKTLTVGMEVVPSKPLSSGDLGTLSMQLRKLKVSTLWVSDLDVAQEFAKEQGSARGNFPGPCPVVYNGKVEPTNLREIVSARVSAVVLSAAAKDGVLTEAMQTTLAENEIGIIWRVSSASEIESLLSQNVNDDSKPTMVFLVQCDSDAEKTGEILSAIPSICIGIVATTAMQKDNAEIKTSRQLKGSSSAVHGIVVQQAIVGDGEDLEYCTFCVERLTKKQSSTFNMSGLTGSTNGHFGGVSTSRPTTWRRVKY
jgi:hypothetical protein